MAIRAPVLIVDGNQQMTAMLQRYLARQRIDTQAASSLADAQVVLAQQTFKVILTDAFLPSGMGLICYAISARLSPARVGSS